MKLINPKFQLEVWNQVKKIPKRKTVSCKYIAKIIGKPNAYIAVANACSKNSFPNKVSCHRVIRKNRETLGYFNKNNSVIKKIILKKESMK